jgi:hypothetical protein
VKQLEERIIELASNQGIWTVLTVALIFYILKNQEKRDLRQEEREIKYQNIISNLTEKLNLIEDVKEDVSEIENYVFKKEA